MKLTSDDSFRADSKKSATGVRRKGEAGAEGSGFGSAGLPLGVGSASRPGWGEAGYQRNFTLRLDPRQLRNLLFSGRFQELPSAYRACRPNLRKEIAVAISVEDQFRLGLGLLCLGCIRHHHSRSACA